MISVLSEARTYCVHRTYSPQVQADAPHYTMLHSPAPPRIETMSSLLDRLITLLTALVREAFLERETLRKSIAVPRVGLDAELTDGYGIQTDFICSFGVQCRYMSALKVGRMSGVFSFLCSRRAPGDSSSDSR